MQKIDKLLPIFLVSYYTILAVHEYQPYTFANADPGWTITVVESLVRDFDLDLKNQLLGDVSQTGGQIALGKEAQWYPVHEWLMPLMTIPFYLFFGVNGCLIFNILASVSLVSLSYCVSVHFSSRVNALIASLLIGLTTSIVNYVYSYSLDIFGALLLLCAYYFTLQKKSFLAGLIWGFSVIGRIGNIITFPGIVLLLFNFGIKKESGKNAQEPFYVEFGKFIKGGILPAIIFLFSNYIMFGSAFSSSYQNWLVYDGDSAVLKSQFEIFSRPLLDGVLRSLILPPHGFFCGALVTIPAVIVGLPLLYCRNREGDRAVVFSLLYLLLAQAIFYGKFAGFPGGLGNRYMLSSVALFAIPLSVTIEQIIRVLFSRTDWHRKD